MCSNIWTGIGGRKDRGDHSDHGQGGVSGPSVVDQLSGASWRSAPILGWVFYQGRDPRMRSTTPTFDKAAEIVIEMRAATWRNPLTGGTGGRFIIERWRERLPRYGRPTRGQQPSCR